jgi:hypothetical protein
MFEAIQYFQYVANLETVLLILENVGNQSSGWRRLGGGRFSPSFLFQKKRNLALKITK